jgi:co-chaperonin GroES (HSP10)
MSKQKREPFRDSKGNIQFPIRALGGVVFILPDPKWADLGGLVLPETVKARKATGVVLSCGPGCKNRRTGKFEHGVPAGTRVWFEDSVPWEHAVADQDGVEHRVVVCNIVDVCATEE